MFLAAFTVASSFAADSESYVGQGSSAPSYEIKQGEHGETMIEHLAEDAEEYDESVHQGDSHHEVEGLPQLDFTTYPTQIFWMSIAFIILYFIYSKKSLPEISSTIENRHEQIQGDIDTANDLREEAESVHAAYEEALDEARKKSSEAFVKAEAKIKEKTESKLAAFRERSEKLTQETEADVLKAKKAAMGDMQSIAAEVASMAAEKIVGISTDLDHAKTMVKNIDRKAA